jgi:hypothetical protein
VDGSNGWPGVTPNTRPSPLRGAAPLDVVRPSLRPLGDIEATHLWSPFRRLCGHLTGRRVGIQAPDREAAYA